MSAAFLQVNEAEYVALEEIEGVDWDSEVASPRIWLKSGRSVSAIRWAGAPGPKVEAVLQAISETWAAVLGTTPQPPATVTEGFERVIRDLSPLDKPMVEHEAAGVQHLDDPVRRKNCPHCE
jgi:hypothetical protein